MRKVRFNAWIPVIKLQSPTEHIGGRWQEGYPSEGLFHCWGTEPFEDLMQTVAIIELEDGTIVTSVPDKVMFVKESPPRDSFTKEGSMMLLNYLKDLEDK